VAVGVDALAEHVGRGAFGPPAQQVRAGVLAGVTEQSGAEPVGVDQVV